MAGRYSGAEIKDIIVSVLVLSVAFAIVLGRRNDMNVFLLFGISAIIVCTSFMLHELAHKYTAQKYGAWAEYRMFPLGLMMAILFSFMGFIFAAPGAVYINGYIDNEKNGKISAAGPAVNIVMAAVAVALAMLTSGMLSSIFWMMAAINAFFALFNLIPISPLDGSKVYKWNVSIYLLMLAAAGALLAVSWFL
jgi:Zn-dependent protease